jgi:hypothetical protein
LNNHRGQISKNLERIEPQWFTRKNSDGTSHTGHEIALLLFSGARAALSRQREPSQRTAHAPQMFDGITEVHLGNMAGRMEQKMANEI